MREQVILEQKNRMKAARRLTKRRQVCNIQILIVSDIADEYTLSN